MHSCVCVRSNVIEFVVGSKSLRGSLYFPLSLYLRCVLEGREGGGGLRNADIELLKTRLYI